MSKNVNKAHIPVLKTKVHKIGFAGAVAGAAAAVALSVTPALADSTPPKDTAAVAPVTFTTTDQVKEVKASVTDQMAAQSLKAQEAKAIHQAAVKAAADKKDAVATEKAATVRKAVAAQKAAQARKAEQAANRSAARSQVKSYPNNLDGWIRESLDIMRKNKIPGSYHGLHKNIMRESSGNPRAINLWDINARNGIPSKGLLQVIPPTFETYHVKGTKHDIYDPVANIVAACNYAADRYGSMDNVNSAY
jgi:Transglycosylase SLT domain